VDEGVVDGLGEVPELVGCIYDIPANRLVVSSPEIVESSRVVWSVRWGPGVAGSQRLSGVAGAARAVGRGELVGVGVAGGVA
jgi:hypothetical protein